MNHHAPFSFRIKCSFDLAYQSKLEKQSAVHWIKSLHAISFKFQLEFLDTREDFLFMV